MASLTNRRDITAARHAPAVDLSPVAAMAAEQAETNELLRRFVREFNSSTLELAVTDRQPAQMVMRNWPVPGCTRLIVRRPGAGGQYTLAAATPLQVLQPNENRLGGSIVNNGSGSTLLFLAQDLLTPGGATPLNVGAPTIFLAASGGSWDLRLGSLLWCGSIIGLSTAGTTVVVAEV